MAQASKIKPSSGAKLNFNLFAVVPYIGRALREIGFLVCAGLAAYLLVTLLSFKPEDTAWTHTALNPKVANLGGAMGARAADIMFYFLGYIAYLLPLSVVFWGWRFFRRKAYLDLDAEIVLFRFLGFLVVLGGGSGLAALHLNNVGGFANISAGGVVGTVTGPWLTNAFGELYGNIFLVILTVAGFTLASGFSLLDLLDSIGGLTTTVWNRCNEGIARVRNWVAPPTSGVEELILSGDETPPDCESQPAPVHTATDTVIRPPRTGKRSDRVEPVMHIPDPGMLREVPLPAAWETQAMPDSEARLLTATPVDQPRIPFAKPKTAVVETLLPPLNLLDSPPPGQSGHLAQLLACPAFSESNLPTVMVLGDDVGVSPVVVNLAKMPHLLISGGSSANTTAALHTMLLSLLYKARPRALHLLLLDSAVGQLSAYDGIPHLLAPVATTAEDAMDILTACNAEIEDRKRLMTVLDVRDIAGFNLKVSDARKAGQPLPNPFRTTAGSADETSRIPPLEPLPFIVVVISELADLTAVLGNEVETAIYEITRQGRAAGVHLIVATRKPSPEIISGLLKAAIPARLALPVETVEESRLILDQAGAERLPEPSDMLYLPAGAEFPRRVSIPLVATGEIQRVTDYLRQTGKPDYIIAG